MSEDGPNPEQLRRDVSAIRAAADTARVEDEEIRALDPSMYAAGHKGQEEGSAVIGQVRDAYAAAGVSRQRTGVATTVWFLTRPPEGPPSGPLRRLAEADGGTWRQPGGPASGPGQRL